MPPTRTAFWNNFVNIIRMPSIPSLLLLGRSSKNSGPLTFLMLIPSCRTAIPILDPLQDFLLTCSVPFSSLWSLKSLPIQNGLLTSKKTRSMPSFPALPLVTLPEQALFTIFRTAFGFPMITISRPKPILQRISLTSLRKKERKHRLSKSSLSRNSSKNLNRSLPRI